MHRPGYRSATLEAGRPGRDDGYNGTAGLSPGPFGRGWRGQGL